MAKDLSYHSEAAPLLLLTQFPYIFTGDGGTYINSWGQEVPCTLGEIYGPLIAYKIFS